MSMTLRDRIKALFGSMNGYRALKDELEETQGDLALAQLRVEEVQAELEKIKRNATICAVSANGCPIGCVARSGKEPPIGQPFPRSARSSNRPRV